MLLRSRPLTVTSLQHLQLLFQLMCRLHMILDDSSRAESHLQLCHQTKSHESFTSHAVSSAAALLSSLTVSNVGVGSRRHVSNYSCCVFVFFHLFVQR